MLNDRRSSLARPQHQKGPSTTRPVAVPAERPLRLLAELPVPCRTQSDFTVADLADQARRGVEYLSLFPLAERAQQRSARSSRQRHESSHDLGRPKGPLSNPFGNQAFPAAGANDRGASATRDWRTGAGAVLTSGRGV